jgi:hypothetical protein
MSELIKISADDFDNVMMWVFMNTIKNDEWYDVMKEHYDEAKCRYLYLTITRSREAYLQNDIDTMRAVLVSYINKRSNEITLREIVGYISYVCTILDLEFVMNKVSERSPYIREGNYLMVMNCLRDMYKIKNGSVIVIE